jgi:protein TonB
MPLRWALLGSLFAHVVILFALPFLPLPVMFGNGAALPYQPSMPLQALLNAPVADMPEAAPLSSILPVSKPYPMASDSQAQILPPIRSRTQPMEIPPHTFVAAPAVLFPPDVPVATEDVTPGGASSQGLVTAHSVAASTGADAGMTADVYRQSSFQDDREDDGMGEYRMALGRAAKRLKRYPIQAQEYELAGTVVVRLVWQPEFAAPHVELESSSGHALLDREGVALLARAARATPLPDSLRQHVFSLSQPIEFALE